MVEVEADIRRLLRGPRHQRIVDDQIPDRRREVGDEDLAEALRDGNPGPLSTFEPFEIGGPLSPRCDGEKGLGDEAPVRDHGADEEFEEGQGGAVRNSLSQEGQPGAERGRDRSKHGAYPKNVEHPSIARLACKARPRSGRAVTLKRQQVTKNLTPEGADKAAETLNSSIY